MDRLHDQHEREEDQRPSLGADRVSVQHVTSRLGPPLNGAVESTPKNQFKACIQQLDVHRDVDESCQLWRTGKQQAGEERTGPGRNSMHWNKPANKSAFQPKPRAVRNKNMLNFTRVGTKATEQALSLIHI